jgi:hypothetical protein
MIVTIEAEIFIFCATVFLNALFIAVLLGPLRKSAASNRLKEGLALGLGFGLESE